MLVASIFLSLGAASDLVQRRISNRLNAVIAAAGLVAAARIGGAAAVGGLSAALLVVALLWIPWVRGAVGGGDVKLAAAAAIWVGLPRLPLYVLCAALLGGLVAGLVYLVAGREARAEITANLKTAALTGHLPGPRVARPSVPYGAVAALAAILVLSLG
jgi:prepilin peptidase CpaA